MRDKLENMLDLDESLGLGDQHGKSFCQKIHCALANKGNVEFFIDEHLRGCCRLRLFWGKIHDSMGHTFYEDLDDIGWADHLDKAIKFRNKNEFNTLPSENSPLYGWLQHNRKLCNNKRMTSDRRKRLE